MLFVSGGVEARDAAGHMQSHNQEPPTQSFRGVKVRTPVLDSSAASRTVS
jgi:hypothetical protein